MDEAHPNARALLTTSRRSHRPAGRPNLTLEPPPGGGSGERNVRAKRSQGGTEKRRQPFLCDDRRIASLISRIDRSISASSSSSAGSWPSTLAWMVDANTSSPSVWVEMPPVESPSSADSHSTEITVTLSLFGPPLRR